MLTFKDRVHKFEYHLNDTDDQIIEYIVAHYDEVTSMSIQSLAENVFTVPNTIVRLSRKLGYEGFAHMKSSLRDENADLEDSTLVTNLKKTRELLDYEKMQQVNQAIDHASRVVVYGIGESVSYCEYLVNGYRVVHKKCEFYHHRHNTLSELDTLSAKDVLILISVSGETPQMIEMAEIAKTKSVTVIAITHFHKNTIQKMADHSLYFNSPPDYYQQHNITDPTPIFFLLRSVLEEYWKLKM